MRHVVLLASAAFLMNGCVALDKYNALKLERDQYLERLGQAEAEARAEREKARILQDQLNGLLGAGQDSQSLLATLQKQNADLRAQLDEVNRKYQEALRKTNIVIPQEVSDDLSQLARQYPDVLDYDAQRGMLKFKSDMTFSSCSAEVTAKAKEVIKRVAGILNSSSVATYELLVAGHTDNVRVSQPRTIQAGHKDNWYLSAHRAITVAAELRKEGIAANRMGVAGYADQRPVASNATEAGKAQNRRVEILLVPGPKTPAAVTPVEAAPVVAPAEINK